MRALLFAAGAAAAAAAAPPAIGTSLQLWDCTGNATQAWDLGDAVNASDPNVAGHVFARGTEGANPPICWDVNDASNSTGATYHLWGCYRGPPHASQVFSYSNATGQLKNAQSGKCVAVLGAIAGAQLTQQPCNTSDPRQSFAYDAGTGAFSFPAAPGLCVDAGSSANCSLPPYSGYAYCDTALPAPARAADLASRLTPLDWQSLLANGDAGVPRLGVPPIRYNEALHGVVFGCGPAYTDNATGYTSTGCPTSFPHATLMGGAFNRSLWHAVASTISTEGRALHNTNGYAVVTWAPDPARDPRWGRLQEVAGEDPFLLGEYIYQYARGLQEGEDPRFVKLVSTAKHFSGYDLEDSSGYSRHNFTAVVTQQDLSTYYWPPFLSAVQRGRVKSIMCSYNSVSIGGNWSTGIPSCAWSWAQNAVVRDSWGFDGFIVSDCGAIANFEPGLHNYSADAMHAAADGIRGGTDVECGDVYLSNIAAAVDAGLLTNDDLVTAGTRLLTVAFETGLLQPPGAVAYDAYGPADVDTPAARQLALEAAIQGMVLLQNNASAAAGGAPVLPLKAGPALKRLAVIGPTANQTQGLLSIYVGTNTLVNSHSLLQALTARGAAAGFEVVYAPGCDVACANSSGFAAAVAAAQAADAVVLAAGLFGGNVNGQRFEDEGYDRVNLTLPGLQDALIAAVAAVGKPTALVLIHGGPLDISAAASLVPAVLDAHYPGELGGDAVAAVLLGDASPSGRLTNTIYPADFVNQRVMADMRLAPHADPVTGAQVPGITHLYYTTPLWAFGFGGSYTSFSYAWFNPGADAEVERTVDVAALLGAGDGPFFAVNVTNTGTVTSDVSALAFLSGGDGVTAPLQQLFDFQRAAGVAPGQTVTLTFTLPAEAAAFVREDGSKVLRPGDVLRLRIGDVPRGGHDWSLAGAAAGAAGSVYVAGTVRLTGAAPVELPNWRLPPRD